MSDDLRTILESIRGTQQNLLQRIETLEKGLHTVQSKDFGTPFTAHGYCHPTEPPSTSIVVEPGWVWGYALYNDDIPQVTPIGWERVVVDLADYVSAFTRPYYYRWCILAQELRSSMYGTPDFGIWELTLVPAWTTEYENPEIASRGFHNYMGFTCDINLEDLFGAYAPIIFPHCALLVRNNGTTGVAGAIEPITLNDRSYSSFLLWDARPWMNLVNSYVC